MLKEIAHLPETTVRTKKHLFNLVTNSNYRRNARQLPYNFLPQEHGNVGKKVKDQEGGTKYGYDDTLPAGIDDKQPGDKNPGKCRFYRIKGGTTPGWWLLDHIVDNEYRFYLIRIPKCSRCNGSNSIACPFCRGAGRVYVAGEPVTACLACRPERGFITCPACGTEPVIVGGYSVEKEFAKW